MEARQHKPTGGLVGEEIAVFATKEEWEELLMDLNHYRFLLGKYDSALDLEVATEQLVTKLKSVGVK